MDFDMLKLENQLCFPLYACSKEVVRKYKPFLDEIGLTYTQYIAMMVMWEHRSLSVKALGEYLYLDSGTITPMVKKLEEQGLLTRSRCQDDERCVMLSLTENGEKLKLKAAEIPAKIGACLPLSHEDASNLYRILNQLLKAL